MKFLTETGSMYEVDHLQCQVRRLNGVGDPTPRMGVDGVWRKYEEISGLQIGKSVMIVWTDDCPPLIPNTQPLAKCTVTSPIERFVT